MTPSVPIRRADEAILRSPILNSIEPELTASASSGIALSPTGIDMDGWRSGSIEVD